MNHRSPGGSIDETARMLIEGVVAARAVEASPCEPDSVGRAVRVRRPASAGTAASRAVKTARRGPTGLAASRSTVGVARNLGAGAAR